MLSSITSLFGGGRRASSSTDRASSPGAAGGPGGGAGSRTFSNPAHNASVDAYGDEEMGAGSYPPQRTPTSAGGFAATTTVEMNTSPRVKHSLARIKQIVERVNPEMLDTLSYGAGSRVIAELRSALKDLVLPHDVVEAYSIHDGQDTFSVPRNGGNEEIEGNTGFIYGLWWMTIEEVLEEYHFWRRLDISSPPSPVAHKKLGAHVAGDTKGKGRQNTHTAKAPSTDAFLFGSEMDPRTVRGRMRSCPTNYVREEYSHASWLPLLKDGYGNYIGVDLDPPFVSADQIPHGSPRILPGRGQVIAFGREIDTKTVLWNGWADQSEHDANVGGGWARFLASFADDLAASVSSSSGGLYSRARSTNTDANGYALGEDDDEDEYRYSSAGRQESTSTSRRSAGLEWMDTSPAYSGLGTIEALVERSKLRWSSAGLFSEEGDDGIQRTPQAARQPASVNGETPQRERPPPLSMKFPPAKSAFMQAEDGGDKTPDTLETEVAALSLSDLQSEPSHSATMVHFADASPRSSTTALVSGLSGMETDIPLPTSPEPSLILSPPSPKENMMAFSAFPTGSPPGTTHPLEASASDLRKDSLSSPPGSAGGLKSPSLFPRQFASSSERERQRTASQGSNVSLLRQSPRISSASSSSGTSSRKAPPPPAAPLGLPTLEFGNGIWESNDHTEGDEYKEGFEVVVDRR